MKRIGAMSIIFSISIGLFFIVPLEAKKLTVPQVGLLNLALGALPQVTARLKLAQKFSHEACDMLDAMNKSVDISTNTSKQFNVSTKEQPQDSTGPVRQLSKQEIDAHIKKMLEPIREFFSHIVENKDMVVPLIIESLKAYPSIYIGKTLADVSHLLGFFNENSKDIVAYFQKRITSQIDLDQAAHELKYFLDDLFDSFSQHVLQAYEKMIKDIQAKKHQTHGSVPMQQHVVAPTA